MNRPIYLDYAATTPVDERVAEKMKTCLTRDGAFGNASSNSHSIGWEAQELVEKARQQVAHLIGADSGEIIFTAGATESDNLAIKGAAAYYQKKGKHIVTVQTEHKAVLNTCRYLETQGFEVTYLLPQPNGLLDLDQLKAALRPDTILVSVMHVNNEIGVIQDIDAIGTLTREREIVFHVDAAQSAGKIPIDVKKTPVDLMAFSAHKIYGPKGCGALYIRREPRVRLIPLVHGGGQEMNLRSGTMATHQIVGMGEAFQIASAEMQKEAERIKQLKKRLWEGLRVIESIKLNGDIERGAPNILNVSFEYIEGEALMMAMRNIAVSSGSAIVRFVFRWAVLQHLQISSMRLSW
jgi:cysteine desulfurase